MTSKSLGLFAVVSPLIIVIFISSLLLLPLNRADAEIVPEWIKDIAKWYGTDMISEEEFLNAIKFLIENGVLLVELEPMGVITADDEYKTNTASVIIPNGNAMQSNTGFYIPLNLEVKVGSIVAWINDDNFGHTVQSQDGKGNVISLFNSNVLKTGEVFEYQFNDPGQYHYFCTIHPWRVGLVTVQ